MTMQDQEHIKAKEYAEAMRYMDNARDSLKKAGRDGKFFRDPKYVSSASGIAYKGVTVALDAWLQLRGVKMPENKRGEKRGKGKSIDFYRTNIKDRDKKLLRELNGAYDSLHLYGYYDSTLVIDTIDGGFRIADDIIERIKPRQGAI